MSIQTTIPFVERKTFYGCKKTIPVTPQDIKYIPIETPKSTPSRKVFQLSDSEDDSDNSNSENVETKNNICKSGKRTTFTKTKQDIKKTPKRSHKTKESQEQQGSTPPKVKKVDQQNALSPSSLFSQIELSPTKAEKNSKLSPKQLFKTNKYSNARQALHSAATQDLPCREHELKLLEEFIERNLKAKSSASLYVSGPPGTGKTACLSKIMLKPAFCKAFKIVYINCTPIKSAQAIYSKIADELKLQTSTIAKSKGTIENYLTKTKSNKMLLLILDEMDQLGCKNQSVLYSIFEWPSLPKAKIILIGIANALDLTDRILPRLQAKCELQPTVINFASYTKQQILDIITERLKKANVLDIFTAPAMQLLAAKVAAVSGDIRRALDIAKRVIELAESNNVLRELQDNSEDITVTDSEVNEKAVDFKEVKTVLNGVYGGSENADKEETSFPIQQKILLCSLMLILNHGKNKNVTIGMLFEVYKKVCGKQNISPLDISEIITICSLIDDTGIIRVGIKKNAKLSTISLQWDQETLCTALKDKALTSRIINDISCL